MAIWFGLLGAVVGAVIFHQREAGLLAGALFGVMLAWLIDLRQRLKRAESMLTQLERRVLGREPEKDSRKEKVQAKPEKIGAQWDGGASKASSVPAPARMDEPRQEMPEIELGQLGKTGKSPLDFVMGFFTDGNVVVRVGIVVLFFGVAFLVKYAAEHSMFPIELRLSGAALSALALIVGGWFLRTRRDVYALLLQGGGIGIFYITVFGAAKLYHLLPMSLAFGLMVAIVVLSAVLALLQDSRSLAAFGLSGGFLAPILTSTGGGSHVLLFSYYALLNAGILGIAWFKAWRELNLLGFAFTFVIGTVWGVRFYVPEHFASTEPFLILFFLFYVAIAVLFALRSPLQLRGYVDGSLVFGVPVVGFALQAGLVKNYEYGLAWSALALALFYIVLATALWRRHVEGMRLLTESFLALGVAFATLAIPLAVDGRWTASAWALEGAALIWIGVRQQRLLPRLSGMLLQLGAGVSFIIVVERATGEWPVLNGIYLGSLLIALAGLFSSFFLSRHSQRLREWESGSHWFLLAWGLLWWKVSGSNEIDRFVAWEYHFNALLLYVVLSAGVLLWLWRRLEWTALRYPLSLLLPYMTLLALYTFAFNRSGHFFASWGALPWLLGFAVQYRALWRMEGVMSERVLRLGHSLTLWLLLAIFTWELHWWVMHWVGQKGTWDYVIWAVLPAALIVLLLGPARRLSWPVGRFSVTYFSEALLPIAALLWLWCLFAARHNGNPWPLPYIPLINPLELTQLFVLLVVGKWLWAQRDMGSVGKLPWAALGLAFWVLITEAVAHTVHHWFAVPYLPQALFASVLFQVSISVVWTLCAMLMMILATRGGMRFMWFSGAGLLTAVVVKLFLIDLSRSDTMERIISFIVVGLLMLMIGYFSPLPPRQPEQRA